MSYPRAVIYTNFYPSETEPLDADESDETDTLILTALEERVA